MPSSKLPEQRPARQHSCYSPAGSLHGLANLRLLGTDSVLFRIGTGRSRWAFVQRDLENLRQMEGVTISFLPDLLPTAEAIGDHEPVWRCSAHARQEFKFADGE